MRKQMEVRLKKGEEYIKLGQALKKAGAVSSGVEAKIRIQDGEVSVNGETEERRGRKLFQGDVFSFAGQTYQVVSNDNPVG